MKMFYYIYIIPDNLIVLKFTKRKMVYQLINNNLIRKTSLLDIIAIQKTYSTYTHTRIY